MGTKNNPGVFDCYANAEPDEPMFVLLGRDEHAPGAIERWLILRAAKSPEKENDAKAIEARLCIDNMHKWRNGNVAVDLVEAPESVAATTPAGERRLSEKDRARLLEFFNEAEGFETKESEELRARVFAALDAPERVEDNDPRVLAAVDVVARRIHQVRDVQEARKRVELVDSAEKLVKAWSEANKLRRQNAALIHQMRLNKHVTRMGRAALRFLSEAGKAVK